MAIGKYVDIQELERKGDVEGLIKVLTLNRDTYYRALAADALGRVGDERATQPLVKASNIRIADSYGEQNIRENAMTSLAKIDTGKAFEVAIDNLYDNYPNVRIAAAQILGAMKDTKAVKPLIEALESEEEDKVTMWIAEALGRIGDRRAVAPLIQVLSEPFDGSDDNCQKKSFAAEALGRLKDPRGIKALNELIWIGENYLYSTPDLEAVDALKMIDHPSIIDLLIKILLEHWDFTVKSHAAQGLGDLANPVATESMIKALEFKNPDFRSIHLRFDVVRALGKIGDPRALDALARHLSLLFPF